MKHLILISLMSLSYSLTTFAEDAPKAIYKGTLSSKSELPGASCEIQIISQDKKKAIVKLVADDGTSASVILPAGLDVDPFHKNRYSFFSKENAKMPNGKSAVLIINIQLHLEDPVVLSFRRTWSNSEIYSQDTILNESLFYCAAKLVAQ